MVSSDRSPDPSSPADPSAGGAPPTVPATKDDESEVKKLSPAGLLAGGGSAATVSVLAGHLGVGGTVVGAFLTSIVSAAIVAFYTDSLKKGKKALHKIAESGHAAGAPATTTSRSRSRTPARTTGDVGETTGWAPAELPEPADGPDDTGAVSSGRRIGRILGLAAIMAIIAFAAIFLVQRVAGHELSPGTGSIQRSVTRTDSVAPRSDSDQDQGDDSGTTDQQKDSPEKNDGGGLFGGNKDDGDQKDSDSGSKGGGLFGGDKGDQGDSGQGDSSGGGGFGNGGGGDSSGSQGDSSGTGGGNDGGSGGGDGGDGAGN